MLRTPSPPRFFGLGVHPLHKEKLFTVKEARNQQNRSILSAETPGISVIKERFQTFAFGYGLGRDFRQRQNNLGLHGLMSENQPRSLSSRHTRGHDGTLGTIPLQPRR